jgi:hypothetical protein
MRTISEQSALRWAGASPANGGRFFDALGLSVQPVERLAEVTGPWSFDNRSPRI